MIVLIIRDLKRGNFQGYRTGNVLVTGREMVFVKINSIFLDIDEIRASKSRIKTDLYLLIMIS